ncbi:MAG: hypothetical protein AABX98_01545, partial [Nanoarchaeota archaeon]
PLFIKKEVEKGFDPGSNPGLGVLPIEPGFEHAQKSADFWQNVRNKVPQFNPGLGVIITISITHTYTYTALGR